MALLAGSEARCLEFADWASAAAVAAGSDLSAVLAVAAADLAAGSHTTVSEDTGSHTGPDTPDS